MEADEGAKQLVAMLQDELKKLFKMRFGEVHNTEFLSLDVRYCI